MYTIYNKNSTFILIIINIKIAKIATNLLIYFLKSLNSYKNSIFFHYN